MKKIVFLIMLILGALFVPTTLLAQEPSQRNWTIPLGDDHILAVIQAFDAGALVEDGSLKLSDGRGFYLRSKGFVRCSILERVFAYLIKNESQFVPQHEDTKIGASMVDVIGRCYVWNFDVSSPATGWWYIRESVNHTQVTRAYGRWLSPVDVRSMISDIRAHYWGIEPRVIVLNGAPQDVTDELPAVVQQSINQFWKIDHCGDRYCVVAADDAFGSNWSNHKVLTLGVTDEQPGFTWSVRKGRLSVRAY